MIRAIAPGRVNLIGDHTDYTGGLVLPMAIDRATVVECSQHDGGIELDSREVGGHVSLTLPAATDRTDGPEWGRYVAAVASLVRPVTGIAGSVSTDIPVGGGLSSSAALEIAIALALGADPDPIALAELCRRAENIATGVPTGIMDQLCIASARPGHATLIDCSDLAVQHVPVPDEIGFVVRFVAHRTLEGSAYADRVAECMRAESEIGPLRTASPDDVERIADPTVRARARHVVAENDRVREFARSLSTGNWVGAGDAMVRSHRSLAGDYAVSTEAMDRAVESTLAIPGVFGARMTGGGFGGCIVAMCVPGAEVPGWKVVPSGGATVSGLDGR